MDTSQNLEKRIQEAEIYHSQGLFEEALGLYEKILKDFPDLGAENHQAVSAAMEKLQTSIDECCQDDDTLTAEDISLIKTAWEDSGSPDEVLDTASAFMELGLYREALDEYQKLVGMDFPLEQIFDNIAECLFNLHSPSRVIDQIENILEEQSVASEKQAPLLYQFGLEMEDRGHPDLALEFYESVSGIAPGYQDVDQKREALKRQKSYDSRFGYLLEKGRVTTTQLQSALTLSKKMKKSVEFILMEQQQLKKEEIGKSLSLFYNCPFLEFDPNREVPVELLSKLKKSFLEKNTWVPLDWDITERRLDILIDDPRDLMKTDTIGTLFNVKKIQYHVGTAEDVLATIHHFFRQKETPGADLEEVEAEEGGEQFDMMDIDFEEVEEEEEGKEEEFDEASGQVVKMVDQILITAYRKGASDIHIEPSPITKTTIIRYRIDGVCQEMTRFPNPLCKGVLSRLKIMSGLDIAERRLPQDGKIKFKRKGIKGFELRLATLPTAGGFEDAVLRILAESGAMALDDMGMNDRNITIMKKIISQPYGLVLVVGPTGSGKTTTLHAALGYINKPGIKIWTAEDPVEISQQGLRQVECKPKIGLDFARVMRAFLRADPDVIMIGEMRDHETASIGVEASLTGHLVFSTLHTNSAPETVTRLLDMGLNPLNFSDAFLGVLAQRLVRRLCKSCRQKFNPTEAEFAEIVKDYGEESFPSTGIELSEDLEIFKAVGCDVCSDSGYKGRLGIHEMMEGTKSIKALIKNQATTEEMFKKSFEEGMKTLKQDGIIKVFDGLTDIQEIRRVCIE